MRATGWESSQKRGKFVPIFAFFFLLSILFFALFQTSVGGTLSGFLDELFRPLQRSTYALYGNVHAQDESSELDQLRTENQALRVQLAKQQELEREISALQDQFAVTSLPSQKLLPAQVVGIKSFVPGFSVPSEIILNVGEKDGVKKGQVVVSKDIMVGRIVQVSSHASKVDLTTKEGFSLTAKASQTNALGIVRGQGSGMMILENILLSDTLKEDDLVVTKGSVNEQGIGSPPGLVLGKIISINKKASELFQSAEVAPLVDVTKLKTVFIVDQT